jgi:hypothetical protein
MGEQAGGVELPAQLAEVVSPPERLAALGFRRCGIHVHRQYRGPGGAAVVFATQAPRRKFPCRT